MAVVGRFTYRDLRPFGVEIEGDLSAPLTEEDRDQLRSLLWSRSVLVFRRQTLTHPQQMALMECFGPVLRTSEGVHFVSTEKDKGILGTQELPFHSDFAFVPNPRRALSLHAIDVVDGQSSTRFVSGIRAAEMLPSQIRGRVEGLTARQVFPGGGYAKTDLDAEPPAWMPHHSHPVLMPHPVTGRQILFVNEMQTARIDGLPPAESKALLKALLAAIYTQDNLLEHVWRNGDLLIWDNLATQHARGDVSGVGPRTLQKVQLGPSLAEQWPHASSPELLAALAAAVD